MTPQAGLVPAVAAGLPSLVFNFCFLYPLFMSWLWVVGSLNYWFRYEKYGSDPMRPPQVGAAPKVALVVPCYNEEGQVEETILNLLAHDYPNFEVIAVNDGSRDRTGEILDQLCAEHPRLRVIHQQQNQGKAVGLTTAALMTDAEYILGIDGDALLDQYAAAWMVRHFLNSPRVGAVTGNPRLRTRSTLLGRIQVGEFSSIIGIIKRAQRTYGRLFSVSGVCVMFRKVALCDVGFWSRETLTEDIDISWKLQIAHWDVRFEPAATCWILMPETLTGLWKQRLRWATGGAQAILKYRGIWTQWTKRRMWPVYLEYGLSLAWSYAMTGIIVLYLLGRVFTLPPALTIRTLLPGWTGMLIAATALLQTGVALALDSRYDARLRRNYFFTIWYPLAYWLINMLTAVVAFPKALLRKKGQRGRWSSPDRGLR
ncbi:poly-beta-1,6-N-acetyl-D-glucosamine synthase [Azoarcus sp. DN11]|uniref:poly-beta-1,6-N-acetyl-D-glucosamine synthase n=1 Tax=Azoarcus sp. DN11 TaxID=356837 RepID=UPI000EB56939|nr:poly-beta-1,6-N-acetyl-D-glucosamine synthase [Azoarcus sp. DN11]AYH46080.1 poly-beta-1,6 N-acetyl-D-glucosamine synthase [Azoarcus sp. DN11]